MNRPLTKLVQIAPEIVQTIGAFGERQLAIVESLAMCEHRGAIEGGHGRCEYCGAQLRARKGHRSHWKRTHLGEAAKELDAELKASVLRALRERGDCEHKNVIPIKSRT